MALPSTCRVANVSSQPSATGVGSPRLQSWEDVTLALVGSSSLVVGLAMAIAAGEGAAGVVLAILIGPVSLLFLVLAVRL